MPGFFITPLKNVQSVNEQTAKAARVLFLLLEQKDMPKRPDRLRMTIFIFISRSKEIEAPLRQGKKVAQHFISQKEKQLADGQAVFTTNSSFLLLDQKAGLGKFINGVLKLIFMIGFECMIMRSTGQF